MSGRWWRAYDEAVDDPKLQRLGPALGWAWFNLMCIASKHSGVLPPIGDVAFKLRTTEQRAAATITALVSAGLFERNGNGQFAPHNWEGRQFLSDSSSERVKRHREKRSAAGLLSQWQPTKELRVAIYKRDEFQCVYCHGGDDLTIDHRTPEMRGGTHDIENLQTACRACNASKRDLTHEEFVTRNKNETLLKRPQTTEPEQIAEPEKEGTRASALAVADDWPADFRERFWQAYPNKVGKPLAIQKLELARKSHKATWAELSAGLDAYVHKTDDRPWCNPATWVHQQRWNDKPATVSKSPRDAQQQRSDDALEQLRAFNRNGSMRGGADAQLLLEDSGERPEDFHQRDG